MVGEVFDEERGPFGVAFPVAGLRKADVLTAVREVVLTPILGLARPAVIVSLALLTATPSEVRKRLLLTTSPASPHMGRICLDPDVRSYPSGVDWRRLARARVWCNGCMQAFQA